MQEIITIISGLLALVGFYWAFIETSKPKNTTNTIK